MKIPEDLLSKYNVAVPRYTSYPPANHFPSGFTGEAYKAMLRESDAGHPRHLALYIHIPFCRKICFYCGCNACPTGRGDLIGPYVEAVKKEIGMVAAHLSHDRLVTQVHYGGGTPNTLPVDLIAGINELIYSTFKLSDRAEIAIECHPAYLDEKYIRALVSAGFNRFSLGIQDFDARVLKMVNREIPKIPADELIGMIKGQGRHIPVNLDFIYGLPGQTIETFSPTIREAITLRPDRLVTFSYAHVPWLKKHQQILEKIGLPGPEEKLGLFLAAYQLLKEAGYQPIGFDHYVLPEDELHVALKNNLLHRNFQGYCTRSTTGQVYAFGASAISQLENGYAQNVKEVKAYTEAIMAGGFAVEKGLRLSPDQQVIREAITDLMCNKRINWTVTAGRTGVSVQQLKEMMAFDTGRLDDMAADGLIVVSEEELLVTETGSLFIRNIAAALDPDFKNESRKYSQSV